MFECIHRGECGKRAFLLDRKPAPGEVMSTKGVTLLDGSRPKKGEPVVCGSCGQKMQIPSAQDVRKVE